MTSASDIPAVNVQKGRPSGLVPLLEIMKKTNLETGDDNADKVFRVLAATCDRIPGQLGFDYRCGLVRMYFSWRYIAKHSAMTIHDAMSAVGYLAEKNYIRYEKFLSVGTHIWLTSKIEDTAA